MKNEKYDRLMKVALECYNRLDMGSPEWDDNEYWLKNQLLAIDAEKDNGDGY